MKKSIIFSIIITTFLSCSISKKPEFLRIENIKILESTAKDITIIADAFFINSNNIGGKLKTDNILVFVNDNQMASVSTESFKVPAKKEFSIPLKAIIPTDSIFSSKNIGGLLGSLLNSKLKVQYIGEIKYKVLGFTHTYKVDKTEYLKIKF